MKTDNRICIRLKYSMKRTIPILAVSILISSCATIVHQPYKKVKVHTTEPSRIVHRHDTIKTVNNKASFWAERKKAPLSIVAINDTITKTIEVKNRISTAFWLGNLFSGVGVFGYAIDLTNPKRFTYPNNIYINSTDTISRYYGFSIDNKGELYLHLSLPHINSFCLRPEKEGYKVNTGFWGFKIGLDYYYLTNRFISLNVSGVSDIFVPFPASPNFGGKYELMNSMYISLSDNYRLGRFTVGYGLSFAKNTWDFRYYETHEPNPPPPTREPVRKSHHALGFIFPTYFQMGESFNIGVIYRPTFYRPNMTDKFRYEHLVSIDFAWKIRLKR